jgi:hypothetical protein
MYYFRYITIALLVAFVLPALLLVAATTVGAQPSLNNLLNGTYRASVHRSCVQNLDGFAEDLHLLGDAGTQTWAAWATWNFDGTGGGTLQGRGLNISHDATSTGDFPASEVVFRCSLNYSVNPDRSFAVNSPVCNGRILRGGKTGWTTVTTGIQVRGQIGRGGQTLLINDPRPNTETVTLTNPRGTKQITLQRICNRSGTALKIGRGKR